jgi:hypothetical protein
LGSQVQGPQRHSLGVGHALIAAYVGPPSTWKSSGAESCVVQAVRRWEFPKPAGGGIVIVSYPFNFTAGGAGD